MAEKRYLLVTEVWLRVVAQIAISQQTATDAVFFFFMAFFEWTVARSSFTKIMVFGGYADDLRAPPERDNFWMADKD